MQYTLIQCHGIDPFYVQHEQGKLNWVMDVKISEAIPREGETVTLSRGDGTKIFKVHQVVHDAGTSRITVYANLVCTIS
ncbi:hypothetical protein PP460_gp061 [Streptomyces phage Muntaha]|uniref:Uncharacterized protein n=1 Tax=Streptomyces phage Muntaha TaxID=2713269 RepID=A0A6G8R3I8_9CAUD|nr:hypothetical protein PP460_gp061 [Streptomyces phage Muntaha]QIN94741.1 hypothetical protein SEA_MUNTAHA_217 [Streptomyces phage Muntaha]